MFNLKSELGFSKLQLEDVKRHGCRGTCQNDRKNKEGKGGVRANKKEEKAKKGRTLPDNDLGGELLRFNYCV